MNARIAHRLVGYDKSTGRVANEYEIPGKRLSFAKRVARVGDDDPEAVLCYKLDQTQARELAGAIGASIDPDDLNFYMEGFAKSVPDSR